MKINVKVEYCNPQTIKLTIDKKSIVLISESKKKILASEIYKIFNHKKGNTYELAELPKYDDIPSDYEIYLSECYDLISGIINDIK